MRALLYLALACAPREFREEYREQIEFDVREHAERMGQAAAYWSAFVNVLRVGVRLRFEALWRDLTYSARTLIKTPLFTTVVVGTLALAIAANAGVFAVLNGLLLQPLPYPDSGNVVFVLGRYGTQNGSSVAYLDIERTRARSRTLAAIAVQSPGEDTLLGQNPIALRGFNVGGEYFDVLGVKPQLGRFLSYRDLGKRVAVISDRVWRLRYSADENVIGKPLRLASGTYTIVGVAGANLEVPDRTGLVASDYWIPVNASAPYANRDGYFDFDAIARSRSGVSLQAVNADLTRITSQIARAKPDTHVVAGVPRLMGAISINTFIAGPISQMLFIAVLAVACVLIVACANVANLLLLRSENRRHELVVRAALGASRGAILNQLLAESALVSVAGGAVGLFLSWIALRVLQPQNGIVPNVGHIGIDGHVVLCVLGLIVFTTAVTTLAAVFAPRRMSGALTVRARTASRGAVRLRALLTVTEIALAFALVVTSGLLVRSYWSLTHASLGFSTRGLYDVELTGQLPAGKYANAQAVAQFAQLGVRNLRQIPGVSGAAATTTLPLLDAHPNDGFTILGARRQPPWNWVYVVGTTPSYFSTLGLHAVAGKLFGDRDYRNAPVGVVNRAFEQAFESYYPHRSTVGLRLRMEGSTVTIVGVVSDARDSLWSSPQPTLYLPTIVVGNVNEFLVRARPGMPSLATDIAHALRSAEPQMSDPRVVPYRALVARNASAASNGAVLLALLAIIALVLAVAGIYGIMAYRVQQQTGEIGLRMALGASLGRVLRSVIVSALVIAAIGIGIGIVLIAAGLRGAWVNAVLYDVSPLDPVTFAAVIALFVLCVLAASLIPAARAAMVDPATALRYE